MIKPMTYWSISSQVLKEEAEKLGLQVEILVPEKNLFLVRGEGKEILFKSNDFGGNSSLAKKIVDDKELSYIMLNRFGFPIAKTVYITKESLFDYDWGGFTLGYPVIIKPVDEGHGNGVMMNITSLTELKIKLEKSFIEYPKMIIQEQIYGDECRVVLFFGKVVVAYIRIPPSIVGDGMTTIYELIEYENQNNPLRNNQYTSPLSYICIDKELESFIEKQGFQLNDILSEGKTLQLRGNSNIGTGGTLKEITNILHPSIISMCSDIAIKFHMDLLCIDIMSSDFSKPLEQTRGVILEIGGNPGFGGHRELTTVNTSKILLSKLFNNNTNYTPLFFNVPL